MLNVECKQNVLGGEPSFNTQHSAFNIQHFDFSGGRQCHEPLLRYLIWPLVKFLVAFIIVQVIVAAMNWVERRLLGLSRRGSDRIASD